MEQGNHETLMQMEEGVYRHLFDMQFKDPYKEAKLSKPIMAEE